MFCVHSFIPRIPPCAVSAILGAIKFFKLFHCAKSMLWLLFMFMLTPTLTVSGRGFSLSVPGFGGSFDGLPSGKILKVSPNVLLSMMFLLNGALFNGLCGCMW